jgi:hypothetical protein
LSAQRIAAPQSYNLVLAVFPQRLLTEIAARPQNGPASTGKPVQSIVPCGNRSTKPTSLLKQPRYDLYPARTPKLRSRDSRRREARLKTSVPLSENDRHCLFVSLSALTLTAYLPAKDIAVTGLPQTETVRSAGDSRRSVRIHTSSVEPKLDIVRHERYLSSAFMPNKFPKGFRQCLAYWSICYGAPTGSRACISGRAEAQTQLAASPADARPQCSTSK